MHPIEGIILFVGALVAGAINAVAGGGSFITFPSLLFIGLPPVNANATSTVALWPGQPASVWAYRRELAKVKRRTLLQLTAMGLVGGSVGAFVLLRTPQATFLKLVPWLLLTATIIFATSDRITRWIRQRTEHAGRPAFATWPGLALLILITFYIGYFGAGAGILILAMLALSGMDQIHTMNALKAWLTTMTNGVALIQFIILRAVYWPQALVMIVGSLMGGYFGAYFAQKTRPENVRHIVIAIGFLLTAYFFARQIWR